MQLDMWLVFALGADEWNQAQKEAARGN